jgi:hypothetical protein
MAFEIGKGSKLKDIDSNPIFKNINIFEIEFLNDVQLTQDKLTYTELQNMNWIEALVFKEIMYYLKNGEATKK